MAESKNPSPELAAWRDFCHHIESLGEKILDDPYPNTRADGPEAIAHLADQGKRATSTSSLRSRASLSRSPVQAISGSV